MTNIQGTITFKKGLEKDLPTLQSGEPAFTTDTKKLFVGSSSGNIQIADLVDLNSIQSSPVIPNSYSWVSTDGQDTFQIPNGSFYDTRLMNVIVGGVSQPNITLINNTTFQLPETLSAGTNIYIEWYEVAIPITSGHHMTHQLNGSDAIDITQLKNYIENVGTPISSIQSTLINLTNSQNNSGNSIGDLTALETTNKTNVVESVNELVSGLGENIYFDEITYTKYHDSTSATDYHITYIPHLDKNGNIIKLKHGYANDAMTNGLETARSFSNRHATSLTTNASIWNISTGLINGVQIQDGNILQDIDGGTSYTLGIMPDNTLKVYSSITSAITITNDGCTNAITGYFPLIQNSVAVDPSIYNVITDPSLPNARNIIAQMPNLDILFLTCEGVTSVNPGMTYADCIRILSSLGVATAYCLDMGGSSQTVVRDVLVNKPIDGNGKIERAVIDFLYIDRGSQFPQNVKVVSNDVGIINKRVSDLSADLLFKGLLGMCSTVVDLNMITQTGFYWCASDGADIPSTANDWGVLHLQPNTTTALQIAFPFNSSTGNIMLRTFNNNWSAWRTM